MGFKHSEKTKLLMSLLARRRRHTLATRMSIGSAIKGRVVSAETREKLANKRKGKLHTEESKLKMRASSSLGLKHTQETKDKIAAKRLGYKHTGDTKAKMQNAQHNKDAVDIIDSITGVKSTYLSKTEAAKAMSVSMPTISNYIKSKKLLKKRYLVISSELLGVNKEKQASFRKKPVKVLDMSTGVTTSYDSKSEAATHMGLSLVTLSRYIKTKELLKNRYLVSC